MDVCIIGAGPSGLCAAKELQEANPGWRIAVYEKEPTLGGTFSRSYNGLSLVNNPLLIAFSDFLPSECIGDLRMWTAGEYVAYLSRYADHYGLHKLIHYRSSVARTELVDGRWHVEVLTDGVRKVVQFDYLVVCSGSNTVPSIPAFKGGGGFRGRVIHGSAIADPAELKGLRVVFVGLGETASDLIHLSSGLTRSCTASVRRRPGYLIPRYHDGLPTDLDTSLIYHCLPKHLDSGPLSVLLRMKRRIEKSGIRSAKDRAIQHHADVLNARFGPCEGPFRGTSTKNCGFVRSHLAGNVEVRPDISSLDGDEVHFADGTKVVADVIVCCTGYRQCFAFLPADVVSQIPSSNALYDHMFVPGMERKLAFVGFVRPAVGTVPAMSELQSRYLSLFLKGEIALPSANAMLQIVQKQKDEARRLFPVDSHRVGHLVDYYTYLSRIAERIGAHPRMRKLFISDMRLWYKATFAFLCTGFYRLHGPGAKPELVTPTLKALPTMSKKVLLIEATLYMACRLLSVMGLRHFRPLI